MWPIRWCAPEKPLFYRFGDNTNKNKKKRGKSAKQLQLKNYILFSLGSPPSSIVTARLSTNEYHIHSIGDDEINECVNYKNKPATPTDDDYEICANDDRLQICFFEQIFFEGIVCFSFQFQSVNWTWVTIW